MQLTLEDRLEILELPGRYGDTIDDRDWDRLARIFTEDATFGSPGIKDLEGLEAIKRFMDHPKVKHPGAHMMTNIYIDVVGDEVRLNFRAMFPSVQDMSGDDPGVLCQYGCYYDTVVKTDDGWRVKKRIFSRERIAQS